MENEIKVGEYVRTIFGEIAKVIEYRDDLVLDKEIRFHGIYRSYICEDELDFIVKHSPNVIDLIEERRLCKWISSKIYNRYRYRFKYIMQF